jgi:hypothetical protein
MRKLALVAGLAIFLASCTTIEIREDDLFDVKRTIDVQTFNNTPYEVDELRILTPDSIALEAWYIINPGAEFTVLYFGGNGFVLETSYHIIMSILEQDVNLLVFNYRGYGKNNGRPSIRGFKKDGLAAYDYLTENLNLASGEIILHGHSLGTFIATSTSNQRKSKALVLQNPVTDMKDWTETAIPWLLRSFLNFEVDSTLQENSNLEQITRVEGPLFIVAGRDDKITPPELAQKLYDAAENTSAKELMIVDKGGHNNLPEITSYNKALGKFYATQQIKSQPSADRR